MEEYLKRIKMLKNARSAEELRLTAEKYGILLSKEEAQTVFLRLKRAYM